MSMRRMGAAFWACLAFNAGCTAPPPDESETPAENVLLIIADDLGVEQLAIYETGDVETADTPVIEELAGAGVRWTQAWSNPSCSPTRAGIYTGRHGFRTAVGSPISNNEVGLKPSIETLADVLDDRPTALIGKWHLGSTKPDNTTFWPDKVRDGHGFAHHAGTMTSKPDSSRTSRSSRRNCAASSVVRRMPSGWASFRAVSIFV